MTSPTEPLSSAADQDYVPTDEWPDVTVMLDGFGAPSLAASRRLEGRTIDVVFEDGLVIAHAFEADQITWTITSGDHEGATGRHPYRAVEIRPDVFFIDFTKGEGAHTEDVTIVLDLGDGRLTLAESRFVDRAGEVRMQTEIRSGRIAGTGDIEPRPRTSELVGKRIYYRYSPTEHYEHIYLNAGTFVWHCVRGGEAGLACADPVRVYALAPGIVILHWSETIKPVESIVAIDLTNRRSIGRMFCWDGPTLAPVHLPFDSEFTILPDTEYPQS